MSVAETLAGLGLEMMESRGQLLGKCPFHDDHRPSFSVSARTGAWICFAGCGQGSLRKLVERLHGVAPGTLPEYVVQEIPLEKLLEAPREEDKEEALGIIYQEFMGFTDSKTHSYILQRGFSVDTLRRWHFCYDEMDKAIVFPIYDRDQVFLGYVKRFIPPVLEGSVKYLYSPHLPKRGILFGIQHWEGIGVVLVEGPLDCIWLYQAGRRDGLSILGSSISAQQVTILRGLTERVTLCFDNDEAGVKGTKRALGMLRGFDVKVVILPEGVKDIQDVPLAKVNGVINSAETYGGGI